MCKLILWFAAGSVLLVLPGCGGGSMTPPPGTPPPISTPPPPPAPALHYQVGDLAPVGLASNAYAISHGHAVGFSVSIVDALSDHGAFWHDGVVDDLGLGDATAINGSDQIILNGKIWEHGAITDIGGTALALNDSGEAIGEITDTQGNVSNFTWTPQGGMQPIHSQIAPVAINSQGDLAGDGPGRQAWIFSKTAGDIDLGTLPGDSTATALAINSQGHAAGESVANGAVVNRFLGTPYFPTHAFFWDGKKMQDLGLFKAGLVSQTGGMFDGTIDVPSATATGLNDSDLVVGYDYLDVGDIFPVPGGIIDATVPFVWSAATGAIDLNTLIDANSGWQLRVAMGIDQDGDIVGFGTTPNGWHGFELIPDK